MNQRKKTKVNICDRIIILILPILLGVVGSIAIKKVWGEGINITVKDGMELVKTIFDVWGILLGFIFTAVSILLTIGENSFINILVETNHMQNIIFSYITAGVLLLGAIVFALILLFAKVWNNLIVYIFVGVNIAIITSIAICVVFLMKIILNMNN